jgi:hypothetical protein
MQQRAAIVVLTLQQRLQRRVWQRAEERGVTA